MKRRLTTKLLLASLAIAPLAAAPMTTAATAQNVSTPAEDIVISIGRGQLISVPGQMSDVFIANDNIADVQVKSQRQLYVFGKAGGETTIYASNARGDVIWSANIRVGSNIESVDQMLALAMPNAKVSVATMGSNTLLLTGTVGSPEDVSEVERLVQAFVGDEMNVISRMRMATPLQVNLRVRFAEVSRSLVRSIGGNLNSFDGSSGFRGGIATGREGFLPQWTVGGAVFTGGTEASDGSSLVSPNSPGTTISGFDKFLGLDIGAALDLAETDGLVTTLSEPNLTALSGETAEFLAGGEFPIPTSQGLGSTSIEYKNFGVSLAYTPTVLSNGRISIRVRPEVSELSTQGAVTINGFQIPALTTRRAETTVELGSGQSFMIAGLMNNNAQNSLEKAPGLGDVPILGNLFRSRSFRKGETELVIVVTPYLVKPVNDRDIRLPTDGFNASTELQQLFGYRSHGNNGGQRPGPTSDSGNDNPGVGVVTPDEVEEPRRAEDSNSKDRNAAVATPGFNL
ncbi:type II and III secretion system protein family protein [Altererythrobacter sp.]|uniref:type II and III secretion system protein family protein n=1 Tax=Altererythrobacter sp. TaxID=1872480 RepID=UPI001B157C89|nr:type II and III secretion system protein family protein [Altererythrobacter sp.]MBO6945394.1 type II and III secretion system protein family protein [Altererythrobacter sp.]